MATYSAVLLGVGLCAVSFALPFSSRKGAGEPSDQPEAGFEAGAVALLLMAQWSLIAVHAYHVAHFEPRAAPRWRGENHLGLAARALTTLAMAASAGAAVL